MGNCNRLFVTPHDSHITEERRIEEAIADRVLILAGLRDDLDIALREQHWAEVARCCREMRGEASQIWIMDQRLQDVVQINEQFARIHAHMERIEKHGTG